MSERVEDRVVTFLESHDGWYTASKLSAALAILPHSMREALPMLVMRRRIIQIGRGVKGSPYIYAALDSDDPSAYLPSETAEPASEVDSDSPADAVVHIVVDSLSQRRFRAAAILRGVTQRELFAQLVATL